jgi:hypothetical protein
MQAGFICGDQNGTSTILTIKCCRILALARYFLHGVDLGSLTWLSSEIARLAENQIAFQQNISLT